MAAAGSYADDHCGVEFRHLPASSRGRQSVYHRPCAPLLSSLRARREEYWNWGLALSYDGGRAFSGDYVGLVFEWDVVKGERVGSFNVEGGHVLSLALHPSLPLLVVGMWSGVLEVRDVSTPGSKYDIITNRTGHSSCVRALSFSPEASFLVSGCSDGTARVWDVASWGLRRCLEGGHEGHWVRSVAVSPDGSIIATADATGRVVAWNAESGAIVHRLEGHSSCVSGGMSASVSSLAFHPNLPSILVSGSYDKTLKVWDFEAGVELHCIQTPSEVEDIAFTTVFGSPLLVAGQFRDGILRFWDLSLRRDQERRLALGLVMAMGSIPKALRAGVWEMLDGRVRPRESPEFASWQEWCRLLDEAEAKGGVAMGLAIRREREELRGAREELGELRGQRAKRQRAEDERDALRRQIEHMTRRR